MPVITAQAELPKTAPATPQRQTTTNEAIAIQAKAENPDGDAQPKDQELSSKFAMLARKEKAIRAQMEAIKAKEEALKAQENDYLTKYVPKDKLLKDPFSVLNENGLDYQKLTELILNGPGPTDQHVTKLESKIAELEAKLDKQVSSSQEQQTKQYDQAVSQIRNETKLLVDSDPDFSTIKGTDNIEAVVELIKQNHAETGLVMSVKEAALQVEEYLIEEAVKMASLDKVKLKLTPQEAVAVQTQAIAKPQTQMKTLTNAVSASSRPLSAKERAIAAFKGQLK